MLNRYLVGCCANQLFGQTTVVLSSDRKYKIGLDACTFLMYSYIMKRLSVQKPRTTDWYVMGNCGGGYWLQMAGPFADRKEAMEHIHHQLRADKSALGTPRLDGRMKTNLSSEQERALARWYLGGAEALRTPSYSAAPRTIASLLRLGLLDRDGLTAEGRRLGHKLADRGII